MLSNKTACPKCTGKTVYRIPSHREPTSLIYLALLGLYLCVILPAIPSKFRCDSCGKIFRRYTLSGWLYLGLLSLAILIFVGPWLIYVVRYAIWSLSN